MKSEGEDDFGGGVNFEGESGRVEEGELFVTRRREVLWIFCESHNNNTLTKSLPAAVV